MVALKGASIDRFIAQPDFSTRAILIYGPDSGLVRERAKALVKHAAGSLDDPFSISKLSDQDFTGDPARLADEAQTLSFTGTRRVVWVSPAETGFTAAIELFLKSPSSDSIVIAEAGDIKPSGKLRKLFEKTAELTALPCYADDAGALNRLLQDELKTHELTITDEAKASLLAKLGADRGLSRAEIQKLCLFAFEKQVIEVDDVEQVCGDVAAITLDKILDAVGTGQPKQLDELYAQLLIAGISPQQLISALNRHFIYLHHARVKAQSRRDIESTLRELRPPVHFKRKSAIKHQIAIWQESYLREALRLTADLELKSRSHNVPLDATLGRALMSLATKATRYRPSL